MAGSRGAGVRRVSIIEAMVIDILGFHADNGSEYVNHRVAKMLDKLKVEFTRSRPRHSNDNGLAETKNGAKGHAGAPSCVAQDGIEQRYVEERGLCGRLQALAGRAEAPALQASNFEVQRRVPGLLEPQLGLQSLEPFARHEHRLASLGGRCIAGRWERVFEHCSHHPSRACARQHRHSPMDSGAKPQVESSGSVHRDPLRLRCAQTLPRQARDEPIKLFARELEYAGVIARPSEAAGLQAPRA